VLHHHWIAHGDAGVTTIDAKLVIERLRRSHNSGRRFRQMRLLHAFVKNPG